MSDDRTLYPTGAGRLQIVRGIPTGYVCPHCDLPIEVGQVRILFRGDRYHAECSAIIKKRSRA